MLLVLAADCGPKTLEQKMKYGEKLSEDADTHLRTAEGHLRALEPKKADDELREARELLSEPEASLSPEADIIKARLDELTALLPSVRESRRKRDLDEAVRDRRSKIGPILQAAKDATEGLSGKGLSLAKLEAARDTVEDLEDELDDDIKELELSDQDFASYIKRAKAELSKAKEELALSDAKLKFIAGPLRAREQGGQQVQAAKGEKDLEKRVALLTDASASYQSCLEGAASYAQKPGVGKSPIFVGSSPVQAEAVSSGCETQRAAVQKLLEAAKKQWAAAQKALAKSKKPAPKKKTKKK